MKTNPGNSSSQPGNTQEKQLFLPGVELNEDGKPANFETAISATGFGKFNVLLLVIAIPSAWSSIFETTTMSFVFPAAQCDLHLTMNDKGFLNAITYTGMISSGIVWGFLCDTLGRRKLLTFGLLLDGIFVLMSASSQNLTLLMVSKFLGGFIVNGPFSALTTYLSEFHCAKHRGRIQMMLGVMFSCANVMMPLLAWWILPVEGVWKILNGRVEFHSWNLYLLVCSLPPLLGALAFTFLPESPKFLMTTGQNSKALEVFRRVYCLNTGKRPETFPITQLVQENRIELSDTGNKTGSTPEQKWSKLQALKGGWRQMKPVFFPPHILKLILICVMQMCIMMSLNTLRLWLPQIFQAMNDYPQSHNGTTASLCSMLAELQPKNESGPCVVNVNNDFVYYNSIIVAVVTIVGYICAGLVINALGKKTLLHTLSIVAGVAAMTIYFAKNSTTTIILSCIFISLGSVNINVMLAVVVDLFPTTLRTMTVSVTMVAGRSGAMLGNLLFPSLLKTGCAAPFFFVGGVIIACPFLSYFLPNTNMKPLQ